MRRLIKKISSKLTSLPIVAKWLRDRQRIRYLRSEYEEWKRNGRPIPPPHTVKQYVLWIYARKYHIEIFIETGTLYGEMINGLKDIFSEIYSIELSQELFEYASKKFISEDHITLIQGDSSVELKKIVSRLSKPALFWLDAHYSGGNTARGDKDTPILDELKAIFEYTRQKQVIVIDDARCFGSEPQYPSIDELKQFVLSYCPTANFLIDADSVRILLERR